MYQPQFYPGKWQFQMAKGTARKLNEDESKPDGFVALVLSKK
jgi:hypothetical protein